MAYPSDLARTKDWGTELLYDDDLEGQFDLIVNWVMAAFNAATGHKHDATANEGPKVLISNLIIGSEAQGDIIYRGAAAWARLGQSTSGYPLVTKGAAANPIWEALAAAGLAADCVETAKILNLNVTTGKLAAGAVTAAKASALLGAYSLTDEGQDGGGGDPIVHNTAYQASTDGQVTAFIADPGDNDQTMKGYCDAVDATTKIAESGGANYGEGVGVTFFVPKDNYWKVVAGGGAAVINWLPLGV